MNIKFVVLCDVVCIYYELLLLRYEGEIEVAWGFLMIPFAVLAIGGIVGLTIFTCMLKSKGYFMTTPPDDDDYDEY